MAWTKHCCDHCCPGALYTQMGMAASCWPANIDLGLLLYFASLVLRTLMGHKANICSLDFHPYGEFVASGSQDTNIKVRCYSATHLPPDFCDECKGTLPPWQCPYHPWDRGPMDSGQTLQLGMPSMGKPPNLSLWGCHDLGVSSPPCSELHCSFWSHHNLS